MSDDNAATALPGVETLAGIGTHPRRDRLFLPRDETRRQIVNLNH